jgi:hypothetical protein
MVSLHIAQQLGSGMETHCYTHVRRKIRVNGFHAMDKCMGYSLLSCVLNLENVTGSIATWRGWYGYVPFALHVISHVSSHEKGRLWPCMAPRCDQFNYVIFLIALLVSS